MEKEKYQDYTMDYLKERYGEPIYRAMLDGYTWEEREDAGVPMEIIVFSLPKEKGGCIIWGRWRDESSLEGHVWSGNWGSRPLVALLIKDNNELMDKLNKAMKDASEVMIEELVIRDGSMNASMQCQPFTKVLATWAMECLKAAGPAAENYVALNFGLAGQEHYEMTVRRNNGKAPHEVAHERKLEIDRLRATLEKIANGATGYSDRDSDLAQWAREALEGS